MASGPTTSWEIDGETVETVSDLIFQGSKITTDGDCSHEIKRRLLLGRKVMTNLDSILKSRDITLATKVRLVKAMVFPVVMWSCESEWTPGVGDGQGGLACCDSWGRKESDTTERLIWSDLIWQPAVLGKESINHFGNWVMHSSTVSGHPSPPPFHTARGFSNPFPMLTGLRNGLRICSTYIHNGVLLSH